jgi:hypothetical protein
VLAERQRCLGTISKPDGGSLRYLALVMARRLRKRVFTKVVKPLVVIGGASYPLVIWHTL